MRCALLATSSSLLSLYSSMETDCFSWCLAAQGVDDSDPWDEVWAACPTEMIGCGTKVPLVLAAPNT